MKPTEFIWGNFLTGEQYKAQKHFTVIYAENLYQKFLEKALNSAEVKSLVNAPLVAFNHGGYVLVESAPFTAKTRVVQVDEHLAKLLAKLHELTSEITEVVNAIIEIYFPELEDFP